MPRPPFDLLRAVFLLLAVVILTEVGMTVFAGLACWWLNLQTAREIGACLPIVVQIREQWAEILASVLALLLAARSWPPPPDPPDE